MKQLPGVWQLVAWYLFTLTVHKPADQPPVEYKETEVSTAGLFPFIRVHQSPNALAVKVDPPLSVHRILVESSKSSSTCVQLVVINLRRAQR
ncbi:hypothetical protein T4D_15705 [Trichinella pseudospiralis]|uniref:Secreted protein n=1 Tax=Trichinella pseudospiralis TaxID=6337 RepID=A0A0V1F5R3_TRIPS|nr:hypothetical protein T4D_10501 [Trichinella pseudospiralis]KRY81517.1 hypothetical protein T4D_15705 [Trichinella pseudospiralis]